MTRASVLIERRDNVVFIGFGPAATPPTTGPDDTWWPREGDEQPPAPGKTPAATRPLPARWSPRPVRVLRRRFRRSQLAADLADYGRLIGALAGFVVVLLAGDHLHDALTRLLGGPLS